MIKAYPGIRLAFPYEVYAFVTLNRVLRNSNMTGDHHKLFFYHEPLNNCFQLILNYGFLFLNSWILKFLNCEIFTFFFFFFFFTLYFCLFRCMIKIYFFRSRCNVLIKKMCIIEKLFSYIYIYKHFIGKYKFIVSFVPPEI